MIEAVAKTLESTIKELPKEGVGKQSDNLPAFAKDMQADPRKDFASADRTFINQKYEGMEHPVTGVPFERQTIEHEGKKIEGVFPKFEATAEVRLPGESYLESDAKQFNICNADLKQQIEHNPELKNKFDSKQLEQIEYGRTPSGYTWHHHQEPGRMQLISTDVHDKTAHTGGRSIWGGGSSYR